MGNTWQDRDAEADDSPTVAAFNARADGDLGDATPFGTDLPDAVFTPRSRLRRFLLGRA